MCLFQTRKENAMGMNTRSGSSTAVPDVMMDMNMTPLIDVMLVLIIMLIITIPIQNHAIGLSMPGDHPPISNIVKPEVVTIDVDFDGTMLWNGVVLPDRNAMEVKLQNIASVPIQMQPEVHLRPNKLVSYKSVAAVMASAQRMGVTKIGLVGNEQFIR
jgi:biopolymer transport protein ExbD